MPHFSIEANNKEIIMCKKKTIDQIKTENHDEFHHKNSLFTALKHASQIKGNK